MGILCPELLAALSLECEISDWRQISQALPRSVLVDLWRGRSAKSCPLPSCCHDSCKAQIILSVWSALHLYWTQPLSFLQSKSSAECRRVEGGREHLPDPHSHGTPFYQGKNLSRPRDCHPEWSKSDREGEISYDIPYMWNLKRNYTNELTKQTHRLRKWTHGCWRQGIVKDFWKVMYTLLYFKWLTNKNLLHSTWNSAQCSMPVWMGGEFMGEWIHEYVWLSPFTVHLKPSQHC